MGILLVNSIPDRQGVLYDGLIDKNGNRHFCGEVKAGTDKQNFLMHAEKKDVVLTVIDRVSFGSDKNEGAVDLLQLANGNIALLSYTYNGAGGDSDMELREYNSDLQLLRVKQWGKEGYEQPEMMLELNNQLYVCGHTTSFGDPMHDAYIARFNLDDLSLEFEKAIKLDGHEGADNMQATHDGNLAICSFAQMNPY